MSPEALRWLAPWPILALAYAAVAVALARRGAAWGSVLLWVATSVLLAALYAMAIARWLPPSVLSLGRLFGAALFVFGTPTGAATAAALAVAARRPQLPRVGWHFAAAAAATLLGWASGGVAALRLLDLPHALP